MSVEIEKNKSSLFQILKKKIQNNFCNQSYKQTLCLQGLMLFYFLNVYSFWEEFRVQWVHWELELQQLFKFPCMIWEMKFVAELLHHTSYVLWNNVTEHNYNPPGFERHKCLFRFGIWQFVASVIRPLTAWTLSRTWVNICNWITEWAGLAVAAQTV